MFGIGTTELMLILIIVIVLFGARRLPELATGIGKAIKNFKKATNEPDEIDVTPKKTSEVESKETKADAQTVKTDSQTVKTDTTKA